jgi:outer membrane lipoprotein-sorting protein
MQKGYPKMRIRSLWLALPLLGALLLAACGPNQLTAEQIVQRMEATRAATNDAHATVALDFTSDQQNGSFVVEGWLKKTDRTDEAGQPISKLRAEVKQASQDELKGAILVSDGDTFWLYSPSRNQVVTGSRADMPRGVGAGGPTTQVLQDMLQRGMSALNVEVQGEEQVAGVNTWKLKLSPKPDTQQQLQLDGIVEATMWVDEARALPLKLTIDAKDMGKGSVEVQSIETNTGLADDLFTFTPPAGATVTNVADMVAQAAPKASTLDEARAKVSFKLVVPGDLPQGTALTGVQLVGDKTVIQNYGGGSLSFSLVQSTEDVGRDRQPPAGSQLQQITVRGQPATLITGSGSEQGSLLRWEEDGVRVIIAGTLSADDARAVAESLR